MYVGRSASSVHGLYRARGGYGVCPDVLLRTRQTVLAASLRSWTLRLGVIIVNDSRERHGSDATLGYGCHHWQLLPLGASEKRSPLLSAALLANTGTRKSMSGDLFRERVRRY